MISAGERIGAFNTDDYSISFAQATPADPVTYQVTNSAAAVVGSGVYTAGEPIDFAGARVVLSGAPADGDSFSVTPSVGQSMFSALERIVDALKNSGSNPAEVAAVNNAMTLALDDMDQSLGAVLEVRSQVGVRLQQVQNQLSINESFNLQLQETLSNIQDLDYAEAVSRFNLELTALQAAQQAYVKMQGLSLFNYL